MKPYKDTMGRWFTKGLFFETSTTEQRKQFQPPFTLKEEDHEVDGVLYKSLHRMYVTAGDITEYAVAQEALGSWAHWKRLTSCDWFAPYLEAMREELEIKIRSGAIQSMISTAITEGSKGTSAAKFLAQKGWESNQGRPSNARIAKEAKVQARIHDEIDEDLERMQEHMH